MKIGLIIIFFSLYFTTSVAQSISDLGEARQYCDTHPLQRIEGIWNMTSEECKLLIIKDESDDNCYLILVLQSKDARLLPGSCIGRLFVSANPDQFLLKMKSGIKRDIECLATLNSDDMAIHIEKPSIKIKFSPYLLFSRFWRLFRFETDNPAKRIKNGLVREYPQGISTRSNNFKVRYL